MKNVLGLPVSTEFNKRIPKQKFYENIAVTPAMKRAFVEQIKIIYWRNKIATTTLNLAAGEQVTEIEVFEVRLSAPKLDESVLRQIDREIPYHILFLLEYEGKYRAVIGYKEAAAGKTAFKVDRYLFYGLAGRRRPAGASGRAYAGCCIREFCPSDRG